MARFLVTGGCGFIGSHLVDALLAARHEIIVLDDLSTGRRDNLAPGARLVVGSVTDPRLVEEAALGADGIYHLAAIASCELSRTAWRATHEVNLTGTINVFEAARVASPLAPVPVVYASSAAVYGNGGDLPLAESDEPLPASAYGADKLGCELHGRVATQIHRVPTVGLRFFNVYGARQDPFSPYSGVVSLFANQLLRGEPITIYGNGAQTRDFVHISDVVRSLRQAMAHSGTLSRALTVVGEGRSAAVFNICGGEETSVNELVRHLARACGREAEIRSAPARIGEIRRSVGDPALASAALGFQAAVSLHDGLAKTVAWLSEPEVISRVA